MSSAARILICTSDRDTLSDFQLKIQSSSYQLEAVESRADVIKSATGSPPHIVVLDAGTYGDDTVPLIAELKALGNGGSAPIPVLLLVDRGQEDLQIDAFLAETDSVLEKPVPEVQLVSQLALLTRLETMQRELRRRAETLDQYGLDNPGEVTEADGDSRVEILLGVSGESEIEKVRDALAGDHDIETAVGPEAILEALSNARFDALVLSPGPALDEFLELCESIRRDVRFFNMPVVVLADRGDIDDPSKPFESGVTSIVHTPLVPDQLPSVIQSLVGQYRRRLAMQRLYAEARDPLTLDHLSGLFSHGFFCDHLTGVLEDEGEGSKNLTVGIFKIFDLAKLNKDSGYAAGDRAIKQVGGVIRSLLRSEDLAARVNGNEFCVMLPDTSPKWALMVIKRIDNVIGQTEFVISEGAPPEPLEITSGWADYRKGDTLESILSRAREMLL